jgi:6-phosphogluconolactonase
VGGSAAVLKIQPDGSLSAPSCVVQHAGSSVDPKRQEGPHAHSINLDAAERFAFVADLGLDRVMVYRFDATTGKITPHDPPLGRLSLIGAARTLPAGFTEENYTAEVRVHPSGRFLYGSNRGHDSLAIYRIDPESGKLTPLGHQTTFGKWPRNFTFDPSPSGEWVIAGNQDSDTIRFFRINLETGALTPAGRELTCPVPICFRTLPVAS